MKIGGGGFPVEVDETYIGGKARNMHRERRIRVQKGGRNKGGKTTVVGLLERDGRVVAKVAPNRSKKVVQQIVHECVEHGSSVMTDEFVGYDGLSKAYEHEIVNHLETYVRGNVYTNGIENFWSLLKRGLNGTYVAVEPYHLFRYVDEQVFRFNNRATKDNPLDDSDRFMLAISQISGKRLTYQELTGKVGETAA